MENTNSDFIAKLERPLRFAAGEFEVGLVEIHFPASNTNVSVSKITLFLKFTLNEVTKNWTKPVEVRKERFTSIEELLKDVRRALAATRQATNVYFYYDEVRNKTFLKIEGDRTQISFSQDLTDILGFEKDTKYGQGVNFSIRACDIDAGFTALYIYANVVEPRLVGDVLAPLLRVVPVGRAEKHYAGVHVEFRKVLYMP